MFLSFSPPAIITLSRLIFLGLGLSQSLFSNCMLVVPRAEQSNRGTRSASAGFKPVDPELKMSVKVDEIKQGTLYVLFFSIFIFYFLECLL